MMKQLAAVGFLLLAAAVGLFFTRDPRSLKETITAKKKVGPPVRIKMEEMTYQKFLKSDLTFKIKATKVFYLASDRILASGGVLASQVVDNSVSLMTSRRAEMTLVKRNGLDGLFEPKAEDIFFYDQVEGKKDDMVLKTDFVQASDHFNLLRGHLKTVVQKGDGSYVVANNGFRFELKNDQFFLYGQVHGHLEDDHERR